MPNRIIKESIRTSKTVNAMTDFQFRIWVYLITYVDDYGRGSADPEIIKGFVLPRRKRVSESDIEKTLAELAGMGCISLYDVDGESYFYFPNWSSHQRIQTKKPKFPEPVNSESRCTTVSHGESRCTTVSHGESRSESESKSEYEYKKGKSELCEPGQAWPSPAKFSSEDNAYQAAVYLDRQIQARFEGQKSVGEKRLQAWAVEFDRCHRLDGHSWEDISKVLRFSQKDPFWSQNILSGGKFRDKYLQLLAKMRTPAAGKAQPQQAEKSYDIHELEELAGLRLPEKL